ncbi:MAG: hypothetical protein HY909_18290 [Deltaproteobacteria bacterium]|nr:hypothetical protein [Deltaproteobacteria bacterium]
MSAPGPALSVVRALVGAALQSPSAENNQPFVYTWDGETLAVIHQAHRARKSLDPRFHTSMLTLGCVLESLDIAADAHGLRPMFTLNHGLPEDGPWAEVTFERGTSGRAALAPWLPRRSTDRRPFGGGPASHPVFARVEAEASRHPPVAVRRASPQEPELLAFSARAEALFFHHEALYREALHWLRSSAREARSRRDGVPLEAALPGLPTAFGAALLKAPGAREVLARSPAPWVAGRLVTRQLRSSAALLLLTTRDRGDLALVPVGRALLGCWLRLTEAGFGVQPHSLASLFVYEEMLGALPSYFDHGLMQQGLGTLRRAFDLDPEELPVLLLRTGLSPSLPPGARTPRRTVDECLTLTAV